MPPSERQFTAEEIALWYTPRQAVTYAAEIVGPHSAREAIWKRVTAGLIEVVASHSSIEEKGSEPVGRTTPLIVSKDKWQIFSDSYSDFWGAGDATFFIRERGAYAREATLRYLGVRLNPADVRSTLPAPSEPLMSAQPSAPEPPKPQAPADTRIAIGAPRKDWWDDFWIAICGKIYDGDLKPQRQADLEKAMHVWASENGHEVSEATVRKVAKKLFTAWKLGG